jgi:hypothetical protein
LLFIQEFFGYRLFRIKKGITFALPFGEEKATVFRIEERENEGSTVH